jgi:peptidylprolyl isomerase
MPDNKISGNRLYLLAGIVVVVILAVAAYLMVSGAFTPVVGVGDNVSVYYTGSLANGTVFGSNVGGRPLNFTVGKRQVISGFDNAVIGMKLNETKTVTIPANEAYGQPNPSLIIQVPLNSFVTQNVQVGMIVIQNSSSGQARGIVRTVNATSATVDFNSPLAGQALTFKITIAGIKKP